MNYSMTRTRSFSKPTREELKQLDTQLPHYNIDELQSAIQLVSTQSPDLAHVLLSHLHARSQYQPLQSPQQNNINPTVLNYHGTPTPVKSSEDVEMTDTENIPPVFQHNTQFKHIHYPPPLSNPCSPVQQRPSKRKHVSDKDENIPSTRIGPSLKRHRPSQQPIPSPTTATTKTSQTTCLNCNKPFSPSYTTGSHACIYHPDVLTLSLTQAHNPETGAPAQPDTSTTTGTGTRTWKWSCCSTLRSSPGCIVTQHRTATINGYEKSTRSDP